MCHCKCVNEILYLVLPTLTQYLSCKNSLFFTSLFDIIKKDKLDFRMYVIVKECCKTGERYLNAPTGGFHNMISSQGLLSREAVDQMPKEEY